jgi:hypothetical protein
MSGLEVGLSATPCVTGESSRSPDFPLAPATILSRKRESLREYPDLFTRARTPLIRTQLDPYAKEEVKSNF